VCARELPPVPLGPGPRPWPDGMEPVTRQATSSHDALHDGTDLIEALSQHANAAVCTNTLDGDLVAWATLAPAQVSSTAPTPTAPPPT
jgi:hypothetical protein